MKTVNDFLAHSAVVAHASQRGNQSTVIVGDASQRRSQRTVTLGSVTYYAMMLLMMLLTTATAWAQTFSGGSGTENDPHQIKTVADLTALAALANNDASLDLNDFSAKQTKIKNV